jgi:ubiquinone biosynthesis protein
MSPSTGCLPRWLPIRLVGQLRLLTERLREQRVLPNENSTEDLIRFLVDQVHKRSLINIPKEVTEEFWRFFDELMSEPELRGLGEVSLDVARILVSAYEPLLTELINQLKGLRRINDRKLREIALSARVVREDLLIFKRQIRALRFVRQFFEVDPKDLKGQADVVAQMVREFGPLFIKMAQVAASNSDFLPQEMAESLAVFREDVDPMSADEVEQAFLECFGELPSERYFAFDASKPLKSGSIASVYIAQKPMKPTRKGQRHLVPVVVKVGRHNLAREFQIGKTVIKLAIVSSHYWAPHSKLAPFFNSWLEQIDEFVEGFDRELDFEAEATNQSRFASRIGEEDGWYIPEVFVSSKRIIEMELINNAKCLSDAFQSGSPLRRTSIRRQVGRTFLHAMLTQMLVYQEFHGDLHSGNVLVSPEGKLYFIDWGNTVELKGIWRPALTYLQGVLSGDSDAVVDSVIAMSVAGKVSAAERREIEATVIKAFAAADVTPLGYDFARTLYEEGSEGLIQRLDLAIRLASGFTRQGLVMKGEYMHLSRSLTAMVGSYMAIYKGLPRSAMLLDALQVGWRFPVSIGRLALQAGRKRTLQYLLGITPSREKLTSLALPSEA